MTSSEHYRLNLRCHRRRDGTARLGKCSVRFAMKKMFGKIPLIEKMKLPFAALLLSSCTINGSFQGLRSYYPESVKTNPDLFVHLKNDDLVCQLSDSLKNKVAVGSAVNLKECLSTHRSIVYIWGANCKSEECKSLNESQEMTDRASADLFVVAEYYDTDLMDLNYQIKYPIIGIDTEYYKSEWTKSYLSKFLSDLAGEKINHEGGRFLVFIDGQMTGRYKTIEAAVGKNVARNKEL